MHRLPTVRLVLAAASLISAVLCFGRQDADAKLPNVVLIFADDMGYGDVGCYNPQSKIPTPHMDQLAADGLRFTNAYSAAAVCVPSRYGLLTGCYPFRGAPLQWTAQPTIPAGTVTLASLLRDAGYRTTCIGKWHCGFEGGVSDPDQPLRGGPLDRGFDNFFGQHGSLDQPPYFYIRQRNAVQPPTLPNTESHEDGLSIIYQGKYWRAGKVAANFKHEEVLDRYAGEALTCLQRYHQQEESSPFFLYLALTAPHGPWLPGAAFRGRSQAGALGDFVVHVDDVVGRVLRTLDELDWREDTLVLLTSDNGPLWFDPDVERYGHDSSGGLRGRKGDIWEGGIRMPLIARWPGKIAAGSSTDEICGLVDVMATLAAVVGKDLPEDAGLDSHNLLPVLLGEQHSRPVREHIILESLGPNDLAIRHGPWKLIPWLGSGGFLPKRDRREPGPGDPGGQLYDLRNDPGERHNVYEDHPDVVARLSSLLEHARRGRATRGLPADDSN